MSSGPPDRRTRWYPIFSRSTFFSGGRSKTLGPVVERARVAASAIARASAADSSGASSAVGSTITMGWSRDARPCREPRREGPAPTGRHGGGSTGAASFTVAALPRGLGLLLDLGAGFALAAAFGRRRPVRERHRERRGERAPRPPRAGGGRSGASGPRRAGRRPGARDQPCHELVRATRQSPRSHEKTRRSVPGVVAGRRRWPPRVTGGELGAGRTAGARSRGAAVARDG